MLPQNYIIACRDSCVISFRFWMPLEGAFGEFLALIRASILTYWLFPVFFQL